MADDADDVFDYDDPDPTEPIEEPGDDSETPEDDSEAKEEDAPDAKGEGEKAENEPSEGEKEGEEPPEGEKEAEEEPKPPDGEDDPNKPPEGNEPDERTWDLTINGEVKQFSTDEVIDRAQKTEAAEDKFQQAAEYTRSARQVVDLVAQDPITTAIKLKAGMYNGDIERAEQEVYDIAVKWVTERLKEDLLPDEQKELIRKERALARQQEEIERQQAAIKQEAEKRRQQAAYAEADKQISAALKEVGLQKDPVVYDRMLRVLQTNYNAGKDLTAVDAAKIVKQQLDAEIPEMISKLTPEELAKRDPEFLKKVREYEKKLAKQEREARSSTQTAEMKAKAAKKKQPKASTKGRGRVGAKAQSWNEFFDPDS